MQFKNKKLWDECVKKNQDDDFGKGLLTYAERWADLMEVEIKRDIPLEQIAKQTSRDADTEGISGWMYGKAVDILAQCWVHGEQLRVWHNADYGQPEAEGVINPAVMSFDVPDDMSDEQFVGMLGDAIEESGVGRVMSNQEFQEHIKKEKKKK